MASPDVVCQQHFEQGVACAMHLWAHLDDAVQDQLGGSDSADKRDWFVGTVVDLFPDLAKSKQDRLRDDDAITEEPQLYDVEYRILQVMDDEFQLKIEDDDDSAYRLAAQIMRLREQCLRGTFIEVEELSRRFSDKEEAKKNKQKARKVVIKEEDNETDWDSQDDGEDESDDDQDVDMDEAPALVPAEKKKQEPDVDEDGFTKVTRKKK